MNSSKVHVRTILHREGRPYKKRPDHMGQHREYLKEVPRNVA